MFLYDPEEHEDPLACFRGMLCAVPAGVAVWLGLAVGILWVLGQWQ